MTERLRAWRMDARAQAVDAAGTDVVALETANAESGMVAQGRVAGAAPSTPIPAGVPAGVAVHEEPQREPKQATTAHDDRQEGEAHSPLSCAEGIVAAVKVTHRRRRKERHRVNGVMVRRKGNRIRA